MKSQSLKVLCQFIIKKMLIITWKIKAIVLSNKKYENIEQKHSNRFTAIVKLFFITDIDKVVNPKASRE